MRKLFKFNLRVPAEERLKGGIVSHHVGVMMVWAAAHQSIVVLGFVWRFAADVVMVMVIVVLEVMLVDVVMLLLLMLLNTKVAYEIRRRRCRR